MRTFQPCNRAAIKCSGISFLIGTLLFLGAALGAEAYLVGVGLFYVMGAIAVNGCFLVLVLIQGLKPKQEVLETVVTLYLQVLNIPIALFYYWLLVPW